MQTELRFFKQDRKEYIRRIVTITRPGKKPVEIWLEVPAQYAGLMTDGEEPLLILALFHIMEQDGECRIHADIDRVLLENLTEHMRIWQLWCPGIYHCPTLIPDKIIDRKSSANKRDAICAFSCGVDACFALMSHRTGFWGELSLNVPTAVMIHGADIFLEQEAEFKHTFSTAKDCASELGIELIPVRTNVRQYPHNWHYCHYVVVAATLSLFAGKFCRGILGSDNIASKDRIMMQIPHGMNYVTDHLINSSAFTCTSVGSNITRSERCAFISQFPAIMRRLRVCWQVDSGGDNCGVCEKCIRTALNFMAGGYRQELPYTTPFSIENLRKLRLSNIKDFKAFEEILEYDQKTHGLTDEVRRALRRKLSERVRIEMCLKNWMTKNTPRLMTLLRKIKTTRV